jgi:ATP-dependent Clp protease ATP-binding subunit ClpC
MEFLSGLSVFVALAWLLFWFVRSQGDKSSGKKLSIQPKQYNAPGSEVNPPEEEKKEVKADISQIYQVANSLYEYFNQTANPEDLLSHGNFQAGVKLFQAPNFSLADLLLYALGDNGIISCMALEALRLRESRPEYVENLLGKLNGLNPWPRFFALRVLGSWARRSEPLLGQVFRTVNPSWKNPYTLQFLRNFAHARLENGDPAELSQDLAQCSDEQVNFIGELLAGLNGERAAQVRGDFQQWSQSRVNTSFLETVGHVWGQNYPGDQETRLEHETLISNLLQAKAWIFQQPPRSLLLVGENGVGKSSLMHLLGRDLQKEGWVIFEAGYTELIAGQIFIGELEARMCSLAQQLSGEIGRASCRERVLAMV